MFRGNARILVRRGGQNFIHDFLSSPVQQWGHQNSVREDIQQNCTHQRLFKNL